MALWTMLHLLAQRSVTVQTVTVDLPRGVPIDGCPASGPTQTGAQVYRLVP